MNMILVGYDLNKSGQDYTDLIKALKAYGTYWHHLDSTWIIKTSKEPKEVRDDLARFLDSNDEIFVVEITGKPAAWYGFSERGGQWLKNHL